MPRLAPPLRAPDAADDVWAQPLGETGMMLNLVVDFPSWVCFVTEQLVADSGTSGADWLARAKANLLVRTPPDCLPVVHEDTGIRLCSAADSHDSSRALLLGELLPEGREDGYFVAVPGRDQLLVRVVDRDALTHVHLMRAFAIRNFSSAPYPISPEVYWVQGSVWRLFPIDIEGEKVTVQPPEEFVELLKRLVPDGEIDEEIKGNGRGEETGN